MADVKALPFRRDFVDFLFCIGVLHHLPSNALEEVRALEKYSPRLLIYLYYALDNRPRYFALLLALVNAIRKAVCRVRSHAFRTVFTEAVTFSVYLPLISLGHALRPIGLASKVPLHDYAGKSVKRIRQDVYDRFFTRVEQRFTKAQILELHDTFSTVEVSPIPPFWHFVCCR